DAEAVRLRARARAGVDSSVVDLGRRAAEFRRLQSGKFRSRISRTDSGVRCAGAQPQRSGGGTHLATRPSDALRIFENVRRAVAKTGIILRTRATARRRRSFDARFGKTLRRACQRRRDAPAAMYHARSKHAAEENSIARSCLSDFGNAR